MKKTHILTIEAEGSEPMRQEVSSANEGTKKFIEWSDAHPEIIGVRMSIRPIVNMIEQVEEDEAKERDEKELQRHREAIQACE
jgi:hypothetical protein